MHRPGRMAGVVWALFLGALLFSFGAAQAAWQPTKPVEFVIPAGTGGGADLMARFMSALIQKNKLAPVNFLVVNKSGGAGAEGFLHVKSQKGNPHVIIITLSNLFTTPIATGVPFNWKDLTPVSMMALDYFVLWVNAESPYKTATEYINAVKAKASAFKMGGTGAKQEDQIITVQMEQNFGLKFIYVPFKGGGAVCANLVGKHVDSTVNNPSECVGIPTMKEATGKDMAYNMLRGIFAAPGIPKEAQEYYVGLMKRISETADWKKYITDSALKGQFMTGPAYVKWLGEAEALHRDLMTKAGLIKK
ncbi:MAG: tripartite tricarboxylate transporter substrate binding protein [Candidatus Tectomicrobia bacterium]|nr:tripartite tricarboxylate transporter substrate binding protein [Candidatus Tectomicrobia bacterium]